MRKKYIVPALIILIGGTLIGFYNDLFLRQEPSTHKIIEQINPIPYAAYFDTRASKPHAVFETPVLPEFNQYCHEKGIPCQFIPRQQLYADLMRIGSIQYIGTAITSDGDRGLYTLLNTLTTLSPYRSYPYAFSQLVIPVPKTLAEDSSSEELMTARKQTWKDTIALGNKGEYFLCDAEKTAAITGLTQDDFIVDVYDENSRQEKANPCKLYEIPHYLAFNYFYYLGDAENSAKQYQISAFHDEAPSLTPLMAALVYGRGGEHLKSATLWYDRYMTLITTEDDLYTDEAIRALNKAIFEIQLDMITEADDKSETCSQDYKCLESEGAIRAVVLNNRNNICKGGTESRNLRCVLIGEGLRSGFIQLNGILIYPLEANFEFLRAEEYNSWRAQPTR